MSNQLVKKNPTEGYQNVFPKTFIDAIKDKESGVSLQEILQGFNMYFLSYNGSRALTRCKVPSVLRKEGLWITYVLYDHTVVTEWYNSDQIDDNSWSMDSNWRVASNNLVGDVSVSADGYWVINGEKTEAKAQGEQGVTPLLRIGANNKLQVSYNAGKAWRDISDYIVPRFRYTRGITNNTAGIIQISMDLGKTWTNLSNEITNNLRISRYIGINESLPTSGISEGTVYMKGPYYDEGDTSNANPIYRMWVYAWKDNTLAWQDNGEFTSISAGVVQEKGTSTTEVMSQNAVTREFTELNQEIYDIINIQSTNVKLYSVISENFAIVQHGNGANVYSCPVEEGKRYKVNFYPIFSSNDTGTYIWVFTNTVNTIDLTTAIAHSELYTEHFSGLITEIELVAPQFAKTLYILSSSTPVITEYRDLSGNTTDNLNSFASGNTLSANAGRKAAYIANQKGLSLGLKHICNGDPITHIDILNIGENKWIKEKNFAKNYFLYSLTDTSNVWFSTPEYHPTGRNLIHIKFRLEIEKIGGATNTLTIYISDATAPGGVHYHSITTIGNDGYFDLVFDPSYYVVYEQWEHFYIWFWVNGTVSASQKISFKFYDLQIVEYDEKTSFANISGETAKDLFESADAKLSEIYSKTNASIPTLIAPNGAKYIMAIDNNGNINPIPVIPNKATIFGNSLVSGFSYVGEDSFGMCASAPNKAFKSLFYDYISSVNPSFVGAKYGAAPFETISDVSQIDYGINAYFLPVLTGDEDLIIIELGDNVSVTNEPVFAQSSIALLQAIRAKCPNARVVWLGIWYGNETKYNIVKNACDIVGCEFITLSELVINENMGAIGNVIEQGLDDRTISDVLNVIENTATNITIKFIAGGAVRTATMDVVSYSLNGTTLSYRGLYSIVISGGIASHPGDRGMKAIANKLLYKLGIVNNTEYYPLLQD